MQIVIAWVEETVEWTGEPFRVDIGERPPMRPARLAKAAMWVNDGNAADLAKAERYAAREGYRVLTFTGEPDPLGAAKAAVLRAS